jgi:hypothetical protein
MVYSTNPSATGVTEKIYEKLENRVIESSVYAGQIDKSPPV